MMFFFRVYPRVGGGTQIRDLLERSQDGLSPRGPSLRSPVPELLQRRMNHPLFFGGAVPGHDDLEGRVIDHPEPPGRFRVIKGLLGFLYPFPVGIDNGEDDWTPAGLWCSSRRAADP